MKTTKTNKPESVTITHSVMLHNLITAVDNYDSQNIVIHSLHKIREEKLDILREAGISNVQSGQNAASKNPVILPHELSYVIVKSEFNAAFLKIKPDASEAQLNKNCAQKIISLKLWLSTGKFISNVGRDLPKVEWDLAREHSETAQFQAFEAAKAKKATEKVAAASKLNAQNKLLSPNTCIFYSTGVNYTPHIHTITNIAISDTTPCCL